MADIPENKPFNPYSGYVPFNPYQPQQDYYRRLEQENQALKEQVRQSQFVDPLYAEFQQSVEYQESKKNNVLTFIFLKFFGEWQSSEIGKQFIEWDKKEFEAYKNRRLNRSKPPYVGNDPNAL